MRTLQTTKLKDLSDEAARAEALRLAMIASSRWRELQGWFGYHQSGVEVVESERDENSGFVVGMLALFRYARGEDVPPFIVKSFLDELLNLMFAGLASGVLVLPSFQKMDDKPWALAWRLAELRMSLECGEAMDTKQFAHLMGVTVQSVEEELKRRGEVDVSVVSPEIISELVKLV